MNEKFSNVSIFFSLDGQISRRMEFQWVNLFSSEILIGKNLMFMNYHYIMKRLLNILISFFCSLV